MKKYKNPERVFQDYIKSLAEIEQVGILLGITSNPLLYIRKILPEENPELSFLESRKKRSIFTLNLLSFPILVFFKSTACYFLISSRNRNTMKAESEKDTYEFIFLSHLVDPPLSREIEDKFLGVISKHAAFKNKSLALFLPHFKQSKKISSLIGLHESQMLWRTTSSKKLVRLIFGNNLQALHLYRAACTLKRINFNSRLLLIKAANRQIQRDCLADLIIAENCVDFIKKYRPKVFFITYEGHTFEVTTVKKLKELFPQLIIMAYQHAPIVNSQNGFFRGLKLFTKNVYLLTSGDLTAQIAVMRNNEISNNVKVLGSNKHLLWVEPDTEHKHNQDFTVLLVPEASDGAALELMELTQSISSGLSIRYSIRLHPRMKNGGLNQELIEKFRRISVSTNPDLQTDIKNAQACAYRSSAAAIQAMQYGLLPIFTSHYPNLLLDPLYLVGQLAKYKSLYEMIQIQSSSIERNIFSDNDRNLVREIGLDYFAQENEKTIEWICSF
jgi:hypothetical protein